MSKLDELIQELCPDGVEYIRMGDLYTIKGRVGWQRLIKNEYKTKGDYYLVTGTDITPNHQIDFTRCYYVDKERYEQDDNIQLKNGDIILTKDGTIGKVAIIEGMDKPATLNSHLLLLRDNTGRVMNRYLMHLLLSKTFLSFVLKNATKGTIVGLPQKTIAEFRMPVPPLPVQQEIVRILDSFTELTAELTAELEARKKQYQYYRDYIITAHNYPHVRLGELCEIGDGLHGTPSYDEQGEYYFVNGNNLSGGKIVVDNKTKKVNSRESNKYKKNFCDTIFMSINGTIGNMALYNGEKIILGKSAAYFTVQSQHLNKYYLYYYLQTQYAHQYYEANLTGSTIKNLGLKALRDFQIPLPSLNTQTQLVEIISHFHELSANIATGLPAEIAARQKQYEYYRDKLLTFKAYCA